MRANTRKLDHRVQSRLQIELFCFRARVTSSAKETLRQPEVYARTKLKDFVSDTAKRTTIQR